MTRAVAPRARAPPRRARGDMASRARARARNRRLAHARATLDASGYFSVERMRARDPALFEAVVGVRARARAGESEDEGEATSAAERILNRELAREAREGEGGGGGWGRGRGGGAVRERVRGVERDARARAGRRA